MSNYILRTQNISKKYGDMYAVENVNLVRVIAGLITPTGGMIELLGETGEKGIIEIRELIRRLAQERGLTLLVSSHLLDELAQVATHYGIIHKGKLVKQLSAEKKCLSLVNMSE